MNDFRIGQHEEAIRRLQMDVTILHTEVEGVRSDTRQILDTLSQQKGGREANARTTAKIAAAVGAVGGSATALVLKALAVKLGIHA